MSEQTEIFLRKTLLGVISDKEINEIIIKAKKMAKKYGISLKELIDYLFVKFSAITGIEKWELLIKLIGKEN